MLRLQGSGAAVDFLSSDHHFGHERISELVGRGYDGRVAEMNEMMVARWNELVSPGDTVLHLGDFALGERRLTVPFAGRLRGRILFMPGNHDAISLLNGPGYAVRHRPLYEAAFAALLDERGDRLVTAAGHEAAVSHYPFEDPYATVAMRRLLPRDDGQGLLVHGHTHQPEAVRGRSFHVGVDSHGFRPVPAARVAAWIDAGA